MVTVVGIGPGHPDHITPAAVKRINEADIIIGATRVLAAIDTRDKRVVDISAGLDGAVRAIEENRKENVVVVVSGDPGFYSMLKTIRDRLPGLHPDVVPGISSIQLLFARIGRQWQDVALTSAHGRTLADLDKTIERHGRICVLTDNIHTAPAIARHLTLRGIDGRAVAGENLSYEDEKIVDTTLAELSKLEGFSSSVLYIEIDS